MNVNQESPNSLRGEQSPNSRPTATAACGSVPDSGAGERAAVKTESRVLRVQIDGDPSNKKFWWVDLLLMARESAAFCNATMADYYARELGYSPPNEESVFRRNAGRLSGDVRVSLSRESFTQWRKHKAKMLRGEERLAFFTEKRALVCRAEHMSKGRRQRHAFVHFDGEKYRLDLRLCGKDSERVVGGEKTKSGKTKFVWGRKGERHSFGLWWKPQMDERYQPIMDGLASGQIRLLKVSFKFERPGRKVFALLTYEKHVESAEPGSTEATLGPLEPDGTLWLRVHGGERHNYTAFVHELIHKKEHFAGIKERLRQRTRRSGPGHKQDYRRALVRAGSFSAWASGRIHQATAAMVKQLQRGNVGRVTIAPISLGGLPMHELEEKLRYKLAEAGIEVVRLDPKDPTTKQAFERVLSKREKKTSRGLRMVRESIKQLEEENGEEE